MGRRPVAEGRVAEEPALERVVHPAAGHRGERCVEHRRDVGALVAAVLIEQEPEQLGLRELRLAAEAAELRVVLPADERGDRADYRDVEVTGLLLSLNPCVRLVLLHLAQARLELGALVLPEIGDLLHVAAHRVRRHVRRAVEDLAARGEEGGRGPAAHVVATVHVRALVVVHTDRDVPLVDPADHLTVAVRGLVHDVAPVAPDRADRQEHGLVRGLRLTERGVAPRAPGDLVRAIRTRREMWPAHSV